MSSSSVVITLPDEWIADADRIAKERARLGEAVTRSDVLREWITAVRGPAVFVSDQPALVRAESATAYQASDGSWPVIDREGDERWWTWVENSASPENCLPSSAHGARHKETPMLNDQSTVALLDEAARMTYCLHAASHDVIRYQRLLDEDPKMPDQRAKHYRGQIAGLKRDTARYRVRIAEIDAQLGNTTDAQPVSTDVACS